jgi:hypothetical protein
MKERAMKRIYSAAGIVAAAAIVFAARTIVAEEPGATISFARGDAWSYVKEGGPKTKLKTGATVGVEDWLETGASGRLEVKLSDNSVIRLGGNSKAQMKAIFFQASPPEKKVSAKLVVGNAWAKVTSMVGGDSKFEIETQNAVAGVRGTTFRVNAASDKSVLVRCYAGSVAAKGMLAPTEHKKGERKQVAGPQQISRDQWEKIVGSMMQVAIGPDGVPGEPTAFAAEDEAKDEWVKWNQERDGKPE